MKRFSFLVKYKKSTWKKETNMAIRFHQTSKEFHLYNEKISYIIKILENGQLGHVY